jgi:hypothetical protein
VSWPAAGGRGGSPNLVYNLSFECSISYIAAPDGWYDVRVDEDQAYFADASTAMCCRRLGRFSTGANFGVLQVKVPVAESGL